MKIHNQLGFTLIEVIVALVLSSIISVMLISNFPSALTNLVPSLLNFQKALKLHSVAESITADYSDILKKDNDVESWQPFMEYTVGDVVRSHQKFGCLFKCINSGKSGSIEPKWRTDKTTIHDNQVEWQQEKNQLLEIKNKILQKDKNYGDYEVDQAEFVTFTPDADKDVEISISPEDFESPHNLLKVVISDDTNERLILFFSSTY